MRKAEVSMHGTPAGILEEIEAKKKYRFTYFAEYTGPSIALTMPLDEKYFDLLNSTIVLNSQEELALPLHGKKNKLKKVVDKKNGHRYGL